MIESLKKMCAKNLSYVHLNYLYEISNKYLKSYFNTYFTFNYYEAKKGILITSPINLKERNNYICLNLSFIFSFIIIKSNDTNNLNNNNAKVLLSVNDYRIRNIYSNL